MRIFFVDRKEFRFSGLSFFCLYRARKREIDSVLVTSEKETDQVKKPGT